MAFAARIMPGVADVLFALILKLKARWGQISSQSLDHLSGDGSGFSFWHRPYIEEF